MESTSGAVNDPRSPDPATAPPARFRWLLDTVRAMQAPRADALPVQIVAVLHSDHTVGLRHFRAVAMAWLVVFGSAVCGLAAEIIDFTLDR